MSVETRFNFIHLYVELDVLPRLQDRESAWSDVANKVKSQILRHVDDVSSVELITDHDHVCQYCGAQWTEDGDDYNGGCCKDDENAETKGDNVHE